MHKHLLISYMVYKTQNLTVDHYNQEEFIFADLGMSESERVKYELVSVDLLDK